VGASLANDPVEHVDHAIGVDPALGLHRERFAGGCERVAEDCRDC
jgi:hypothetical protein